MPGDSVELLFFSQAGRGGLEIYDNDQDSLLYVTAQGGPQLYTGSEYDPTFLTGIFTLTDGFTGAENILTISDTMAAVPEPASWGTLVLGLGMIGGALRRRARVTRVAYA